MSGIILLVSQCIAAWVECAIYDQHQSGRWREIEEQGISSALEPAEFEVIWDIQMGSQLVCSELMAGNTQLGPSVWGI